MTENEKNQLWSDFLEAWSLERLRTMTLEEYTNPEKNDAFIYWLEKRLADLGSIWGGSAFKFGIYCRDNKEEKTTVGGRIWGVKYAWLSRFGKTESEAFATVRSRLVEVIEAVQAGNLVRIDEIDLAPVLKWKPAFLYQDRDKPLILPIFKKEMLFYHYQAIDPTARLDQTPYSVMYSTLMERHKDKGSVHAIGEALWTEYEANRGKKVKAWAVPLSWAMELKDTEALCNKTRVEPEDVDPYLNNLLSAAQLGEGDLLGLLIEGDVRALGTVTLAESGEFSWDQIPVNFSSGLLVVPTSEVKELTASEREQIWSQAPETKVTEQKFWKISPGRNAVAWDVWREKGIASIGWPDLGDLSAISKNDFDIRADECSKKHPGGYKKKGTSQVWVFRGIKPGDRVIANDGQSKVVGIGTVIEGYRYSPDGHTVEGEDYPHQILVRWDDTNPRKVNRPDWIQTIKSLLEVEFNAIVASPPFIKELPEEPKVKPLAPPSKPHNIILYGPPGTGKTYSTVRRALQLILGEQALESLSDEALIRVFREKQAQGQVDFVTFHQSYGYEEFVEGIRPVFGENAEGQVQYELHDGVFKRIALRAAAEGLISKEEELGFDTLWTQFLRDVQKQEDRVAVSASGKSYVLRTSGKDSVRIYPCELDEDGSIKNVNEASWQTAGKEYSRILWDNRNELGPEPEKVTSAKTSKLFAKELGGMGGHHYTALWIAYGQLFGLSKSAAGRRQEMLDPIDRVQQTLDKPTAGGASFAFSSSTRQYVLIIDEINRGNISKILGELITLLEPDKRLGMPCELKLPLSYSPEHRFAVPPNLHVIGTMNTADRSIALMDVALRRRFTFEELMPESSIIRSVLEKDVAQKPLIDLIVDLFDVLNHRIRFLYDRDHQLGHAYFLGIRNLEDLRLVFVDRVIPLLQEYFYGSWDKICMVLGCPYTAEGAPERGNPVVSDGKYNAPIITAKAFEEEATLGFDHSEYESKLDYLISDRFYHGNGPDGKLVPYFLGVLPDSRYDERKKAFSETEKAENETEGV